MKEKNYIFICLAGESRSPTAARVAEEMCREKGINAKFAFGGIDVIPDRIANMHDYLNFFDAIYVMKEDIRNRVVNYGIDELNVESLDIDDDYDFMEEGLIEILKKKLSGKFG